MKIKPISPQDISFISLEDVIPENVIKTVNLMIKEKYRGGKKSLIFTVKELIELAKENNLYGNKDWYTNNYLDFEELYRKNGRDVKYDQPTYRDDSFDPYYTFTPKKINVLTEIEKFYI